MSKGEFLGEGVVAYVGLQQFTGHELQGLFVAEYDVADDSYTLISFPQNPKFTQFFENLGKGQFAADEPINVGVVLRFSGFRRYPYTVQPNYQFQFVLPGEDTAPLLKLITDFAESTKPVDYTTQELGDPSASEINQQGNIDSEKRWKQLGYNTKEDWINAGRP